MRYNPMLAKAKRTARDKYAWPGGYEMFAIADDGACICSDCVKKEWPIICHSTMHRMKDGWRIVAIDNASNLDEPETCDHCGREIA